MSEMLVVEIPSDTRRRLELMGFPYDISGRDIACFLIEQGLAVLEKHRGLLSPRYPASSLALGRL